MTEAQTVLRPLGLFQKGRSRIWLDDHGWWLCVVEFQPSDWSKGSYVNVGCTWLWHEKDYPSFDVGNRVEGFHKFVDEDQFKAVAASMAEKAAMEATRYRGLFSNIHGAYLDFLRHPPKGLWPIFNAAVTCALTKHTDEAHRLFDRIITEDDDTRDWAVNARNEARSLKSIAHNPALFRTVITDKVHRTRKLQKLAALSSVNFDE